VRVRERESVCVCMCSVQSMCVCAVKRPPLETPGDGSTAASTVYQIELRITDVTDHIPP
jgi:hypothetical protein